MDKTHVIYYWYDHLVLRANGDAEKVTQAIKDHDYKTFMYFVNKYGAEYFPQEATIFSDETNEIIGFLDMSKEIAFRMVTDSDYECG